MFVSDHGPWPWTQVKPNVGLELLVQAQAKDTIHQKDRVKKFWHRVHYQLRVKTVSVETMAWPAAGHGPDALQEAAAC